MGYSGLTDEERFMRFIKKNEVTGCWIWQGGLKGKRSSHRGQVSRSYGQFGMGAKRRGKPKIWKSLYAHRAAYRLFVGPIPKGKVIRATCGNSKCVSPQHLRLYTLKEVNRIYQIERTHCRKGHLLTPDNTFTHPDGRRQCMDCPSWRDSIRTRYLKPPTDRCLNGHKFTAQNTIETKSGRFCRACKNFRETLPDPNNPWEWAKEQRVDHRATLAQIGEVLWVSRQRVDQMLRTYPSAQPRKRKAQSREQLDITTVLRIIHADAQRSGGASTKPISAWARELKKSHSTVRHYFIGLEEQGYIARTFVARPGRVHARWRTTLTERGLREIGE